MGKVTLNIFMAAIILSLISACGTSPRKKDAEKTGPEKIAKQVFLIGNGSNSAGNIEDIIEKSEIRKGGYVVIVNMLTNNQDSSAYFLRKSFFDQQIMAVHDFRVYNGISLHNSDIIKVKNARIICILDNNANKFLKLAKKTRLKSSLLDAHKLGALIVGIGKGASILGEYYYEHVKDKMTHRDELAERPGLGILKNTVIEDIDFYTGHKATIETQTTEKGLVFIGLDGTSVIWVKNNEAVVLRGAEIGFAKPNKPSATIKGNSVFELLPQ